GTIGDALPPPPVPQEGLHAQTAVIDRDPALPVHAEAGSAARREAAQRPPRVPRDVEVIPHVHHDPAGKRARRSPRGAPTTPRGRRRAGCANRVARTGARSACGSAPTRATFAARRRPRGPRSGGPAGTRGALANRARGADGAPTPIRARPRGTRTRATPGIRTGSPAAWRAGAPLARSPSSPRGPRGHPGSAGRTPPPAAGEPRAPRRSPSRGPAPPPARRRGSQR